MALHGAGSSIGAVPVGEEGREGIRQQHRDDIAQPQPSPGAAPCPCPRFRAGARRQVCEAQRGGDEPGRTGQSPSNAPAPGPCHPRPPQAGRDSQPGVWRGSEAAARCPRPLPDPFQRLPSAPGPPSPSPAPPHRLFLLSGGLPAAPFPQAPPPPPPSARGPQRRPHSRRLRLRAATASARLPGRLLLLLLLPLRSGASPAGRGGAGRADNVCAPPGPRHREAGTAAAAGAAPPPSLPGSGSPLPSRLLSSPLAFPLSPPALFAPTPGQPEAGRQERLSSARSCLALPQKRPAGSRTRTWPWSCPRPYP